VTVHAASMLESAPIGLLQAPASVLACERMNVPPAPPPAILRDGVLAVYVDGSGDGAGGWGVVVVEGSRGTLTDLRAQLRAEFYGPLVLDSTAPPYLGVERVTNNTAELTCLAEGLMYLRDVDGSTGPAVLRPDSEYAMNIATGLSRPHENRELACRVRSLWQAEEARRGGQLWALHVKGHLSSKWNQQADRGAARGAQGFVRGVGHRWASWPPLPSRKPRAHEISMSQRVMRATHAFGVLAIPVPVSGEAVTQATLDASLACVEGALSREHGPQSSVALQRARASHLLLSDSSRQRAEAGRLIAEGMQPVTSEVMCPVNSGEIGLAVKTLGHGGNGSKHSKNMLGDGYGPICHS